MPRSRRKPPEPRGDRAGVRVGVYAGEGASHSWLWTVDCLEAEGFPGVRVLDHEDLVCGRLEVDALVVGGGDPYAMADALGATGAAALRRFVEGGGRYFGFCAGSYLVSRVDPPSLYPFRLTHTAIGNVVDELPEVRVLPTKAATVYGDAWVLHPVRERVRLRLLADSGRAGELEAPLYGGAAMYPGNGEDALAHYAGFCRDTLYLVEPELARAMFLGTAAGVRRRVGRGDLLLFGPHLEAPGYPEANALFGSLVAETAGGSSAAGGSRAVDEPSSRGQAPFLQTEARELRRHLGDARIAANAMLMHDVSWKLGEKFYEPAKIPVFLEAVWRRLEYLLPLDWDGGYEAACADAALCASLVRDVGRRLRAGQDATAVADELFRRLRRLSTAFLNAYFAGRRFSVSGTGGYGSALGGQRARARTAVH